MLVFHSALSAQKANVADAIITVEGYGLSTTENDALTQAKRDAVEKGIGVTITSETETKNFMIQKDIVITHTMGSVKKYDVLSKGKTADNLFEIKIKAEVSLASIRADLAALKILLESMDKPRVMVLLQETRKGEQKAAYTAASTALLDYLTSKEFNVIDPAQTMAAQSSSDEDIAKAASGDAVAAAKLGRDNGAEVILVGKAVGDIGAPNSMLGNMKSGQGTINVQVINCQNGKIITAKTAHSAKPHISEETAMANALKAAVDKLMDKELFEKIVGHWQDMVNNGQELKVTVTGVDNFAKRKEILAYFQGLSGNVVKVVQRNWNQSTGALDLDVLFKGSSDSFAESTDGQKTTSGLKFAVMSMTSGIVKLSVK
jgi:hypothetical protein